MVFGSLDSMLAFPPRWVVWYKGEADFIHCDWVRLRAFITTIIARGKVLYC
jgi:hypothetical protein